MKKSSKSKRRRTVAGWTVVSVALAFLALAATAGQRQTEDKRPELLVDDSVASDFEALAAETWTQFLTVFQARTECFGDVHLHASPTLDSRATYDPDSATVTVRVPGSRALLQGALIHEWAHHLEFQCPQHVDLRPAFLAAQGLSPDTPWRLDDRPADTPENIWRNIPSEQYTEATIELVLGRRQIPTRVRVSREAVEVIEAWASRRHKTGE